jgi:hypothetical protein
MANNRRALFFTRMKKCFSIIFCIVCVSAAMATSIPNTSPNPKTFLGPTGSLGVTKLITDNTAFSVAGELGPRDLRLGGTLGWDIDYYQRIKASGELLRQKITYSFFSGRAEPWLNQGAVGLDYQYNFRDFDPVNTILDLSAYYSHAPSANLGTITGTYIPAGSTTPVAFIDERRIAGSNAAGVSPGISVTTLSGTRLGAALNYDNVRYNTENRPGVNATGLGGTVKLNQAITEDLSIGASAAVRQPFNNYQADIALDNVNYYGVWIFKLFGAYTIGKNSLPTTYNVGIGADYLIDAGKDDVFPTPQPTSNFKDQIPKQVYKDGTVVGFKDQPPMEMPEPVDKDFLAWVAEPAVYMPQVLAITDESVCVPPTFNSAKPLGGAGTDFTGAFTYTLSNSFTGSNLKYKINFNPGDVNNGSLKIVSGILSGTGCYPPGAGTAGSCVPASGGYADITVTASNACGSVTSNAFDVGP